MPPSDRLEEIGALATMIDENLFRYSLDALCEQLRPARQGRGTVAPGGRGRGLRATAKEDQRQEYIWQLPARYVGPYAEADAVNTLAAV